MPPVSRVDHYWFKQHTFAISETVKIKQNMVTCGHILPVSLKIIVFVSSIISITRLFERTNTLDKLQTFTKTCTRRQQNS